ncbi:MAG: hypothetical protein IIC66_04610, partial [candidate division Zixibacteria bacterium]|nr:hypothetical protein [candidate division Zixibacteria bacterium]
MKRLRIQAGLIFLLLVAASASGATLTVERGTDFQAVINFASSGDTILLSAKVYDAAPIAFTDSLCGNCPDPRTLVAASYGFIIKNKSLVIIGANRQKTILLTKGGYGVYFVNSPNSIIRNLTITGGRRDADGNATDAAIVVRNSRLLIEEVDIRDNDNRHE